MFRLIETEFTLKTTYSQYRNFYNLENVKQYIAPILELNFAINYKSVGQMLYINDLKLLEKPNLDEQDLSKVNLRLAVVIAIATIEVGQILPVIVQHIDESANIIAHTGIFKIYIHHSQINSNCTYNYQKNCIEFNKRVIKIKDVLKVKVTQKYFSDDRKDMRYRGTIKSPTLGKKSWWS